MRCRRRKLQCRRPLVGRRNRRIAASSPTPPRPTTPNGRPRPPRPAGARPRQRRTPRPRGRHHPGRDLEADRGLARGRRGDRRARRDVGMRSNIRWTCSTRAPFRTASASDAREALADLEVAWSIDSTNSELLRRNTNVRKADVLLAERQTGGRGRLGPHLGLAAGGASVPLASRGISAAGWRDWAACRLVAGIAAAEALHALGARHVKLKWPNDLVVEDGATLRKLGGLLVEGGGEHGGPVRAVIGLGLNVRMPAAFARDIDQPWSRPGHARRNAHAQCHRRDGAFASVAGVERRSTATASNPSSRATPPSTRWPAARSCCTSTMESGTPSRKGSRPTAHCACASTTVRCVWSTPAKSAFGHARHDAGLVVRFRQHATEVRAAWRGRQRRARARVRAVGARCVAVGRSRVPGQRRERRRARAIARCLVAPLPPHRHRAHGGDVRRPAHRVRQSAEARRRSFPRDGRRARCVARVDRRRRHRLDDRPGRRRRTPPRRPHRALADAHARNAARPRDATRADGRHVRRIRRTTPKMRSSPVAKARRSRSIERSVAEAARIARRATTPVAARRRRRSAACTSEGRATCARRSCSKASRAGRGMDAVA